MDRLKKGAYGSTNDVQADIVCCSVGLIPRLSTTPSPVQHLTRAAESRIAQVCRVIAVLVHQIVGLSFGAASCQRSASQLVLHTRTQRRGTHAAGRSALEIYRTSFYLFQASFV